MAKLDNIQTVIALLSLITLVVGTYFGYAGTAAQNEAYRYLKSDETTSIPTVTVSQVAESSTCRTETQNCVIHCNYTVAIPVTVGLQDALSGFAVHVKELKQAELYLQVSETSFWWKNTLDNIAIILLMVSLTISVVKRGKSHKPKESLEKTKKWGAKKEESQDHEPTTKTMELPLLPKDQPPRTPHLLRLRAQEKHTPSNNLATTNHLDSEGLIPLVIDFVVRPTRSDDSWSCRLRK
jgi:hypothetical protein